MKNDIEELILGAVRQVPPLKKRNVLSLYAHALAALACLRKSQEDSVPFRSLAEAWNSPMAKPMREYIDVWGAGFQISSMDEDTLQNLCDALSEFLPEETNIREAFYVCVKLLYVAQLWDYVEDVHYTASQLSKTDSKVVSAVLSELGKKIPAEVADSYNRILEWNGEETAEQFWPHLFGYCLERREIRQSGKVTDGLALLEETGLGPDRKLQVYSCVRTGFYMKRKDDVEYPFRLLRKVHSPDAAQLETKAQGKALAIVRGKDGTLSFQSEYFSYEATFDKAIEAIKSVEPVRFFLAIGKYSLRRTELATELAVSVGPFLQQAHTVSDCMILEPNPLVVELAAELNSGCLLVFLSLETAFLYQTQFPKLNIGYLDIGEQSGLYKVRIKSGSSKKDKRDKGKFNLTPVASIQDTLAFMRNGTRDQCREVLSALYPLLGENSTLDLYLPNDILEGDALENLDYDLQSGTILPSYKEDSVPNVRKKNVLLTMKKRAGAAGKRPDVSLYKLVSVTEEGIAYLICYPYTVDVPFNLLRENNGHGLTWHWNHYNLATEDTKQRKTREYRYSAEISLWYSWSPNSKRGKYHFCALPSKRQSNHNSINRGTSLTRFVWFSAKTEEAAASAVAAGLELADFRQTIQKELEKLHKIAGMSFKSYYYCCRDELAEKPVYNREIAELLFTSEAFDTLRTSDVYTLEDYQQVMDGFLASISNKKVRIQYWEQLNLLLNYAERAEHIESNPVRGFVYGEREKDERYREIRAALVKKSFTIDEERAVLDYLEQKFLEDSLFLGCAIRFFTGISVSEILALTWDDFNKLTFLDAGYLFVTKDLRKKKVNRYAVDDPKVRLVPCCPQLYRFLKQRKNFVEVSLKKAGIKMDDLPIVSANNNDLTKRASVDQIKVATAFLIKKAGISENKIRLPIKDRKREEDINDYHGELLRANFEYRATETCRMTPGEIAYILGRQPPDTFSRHYCDYGNIESQTVLVRKLMRWDALHRRKESPVLFYIAKRSIPGDGTQILQSKKYDRPYLTELWLNANPADSGVVQLEILDQSGADIEIFSEDGGWNET